jgi:sugar lactone lactonase YvrE
VVQLLALVLASLISQRSLSAQLVQSNGKVIFTLPATTVGTGSGPQNLLLKTTSAVSITSFTVPLSQGSKKEYTVGTVTGCTVDGSTVNPSGTICTVPITFTPAYPGTRAVPLHIVTSGGNVNIALAGSGTSPLTSITPGVMSTIAGDVNASNCAAYNGPATQGPQCNPSGVAVDAAGNVYIVSFYSNTVSKVDTSGNVTVIAGTGAGGISGVNGPATEANVERPADVVVDPAGNVYFADESAQQVFRIDAITQILTSVAGNGTQGYSGDNGPATAAELNRPEGVALDLEGNLYIEDQDNNLIRKVDTSGVITTVAGDPTTAGNSDPTYGGDGGPATKAGLALCCSGVAASYDSIGVDASGNLFIGDSGHHVIRKVTTDGIIHTVAGNNTLGPGFSGDGGAATSAQLNEPMGVTVDPAGDLYIADFFNNRIRKVDTAGVITTVAGNGIGTFAGDGGPATLASLSGPQKVELDGQGNLYIGDTKNNLVRKVTVAGPTLTFATPTRAGTTDTTDGPLGVTVSDIGNAPLTLEKPASGSNPTISANFSLFSGETGACPTLTSSSASATLAEGASCALDVNFAPVATGSLTGSLVLTDNSLNAPANADTISLAGMGTGPTASFSPTSLSFPSTTVNTTTAAMTTTLSNTGTATLNIAGITITGTNASNFAETSTCAATLAAGSNCIISVTFTPTVPGAATATLSLADDAADSPQTVALSGTGAAVPSSVTETGNLWFNPAPVAIAAASAQTLTATFKLTGFSSLITPTAKMNYGLAYKAGKVTCTGTAGNQTCTVPVTFIPNYPGGRRDALFLMNGTTRLATQLAYGIGQSPFALIQPGIVTNPVLNSPNYQYTSVTGEDGTLYQLEDQANAVEAVTAAGVVTTLPITGLNSPRGIGIDGAGILYIVDQTYSSHFTTYDTVQGIQGSIPFPDAGYFQTLAVGNEGTLYAYGNNGNGIWTVPASGTPTLTVLNPNITQPGTMTVDSAENVFVGGYTINEITAGGVQTQVNAVGAGDGISTDAAGTIYATRYTGVNGVALLPASNYGQQEAAVDYGSPLGMSVGPDGTVYVGNYSIVDKVDRSQGVISFGEQFANTAATPQAVQIYNGGNETLTVSNITISGEAFTLNTDPTKNCTKSGTIAAGAFCNLSVAFLPTHAGTYSGTVTITSNSLNNTTTTQTVALSGFVYGVYVQASPDPLAFGNQTVNTTSSALTVTFTNNGDLYSADIGGFTSSDPAFVTTVGSSGCFNVGVAQTCTATVTFTPTAAKSYSSTISYSAASSGGGPNQNGSFTATGTGTPAAVPVASLSPTTLAFPNTAVGATASAMSTTLSNTGNATLNISGITLSDTTNFAETTTCGSTLAAGKTCSVSVTFKPGSATAFTATLSVADDAAGTPQTVALSGTGTAPAVTFSPTSLSFPNTNLNTTSAVLTSKLSNTGNGVLNISGVTLGGLNPTDFAQTNTCGTTLAAGANCIISVTFTPTTATNLSATINVADNATGSPQGLSVSGTGLGGVSVSPSSIAFGNEEEYTENYNAQKVTITNTGSATITFGTLVFSTNFVLYQDDCGSQLLGNSSCYYLVAFYPKGVGSFTGTLSIPFTGSTGSPLTVSFTGTGTAASPVIALYPTPVNFGTIAVGTAATPIVVDVQNAGYAPLTGITASISGPDAAEFTQTNDCSGVTIDPPGGSGGDCKVTVNFTPAAAGPRSATLTVTSNGGTATTTATLSGGGVAQSAQLQFSPTQLNLSAGAGGPCADATTGGLATAATLCNITGTTQDYLGNTYLVDNTYNVVYKVDTAGAISVFAGTPSKTGGYTGDNGPATSATLSGPTAVATDAFGNVFISDTGNSAIREVDTTGMITSFVDGTCYVGGRGTPMSRSAAARPDHAHPHEVQLCEALQPQGLVVDPSGNLIFADTHNNVVLEVGILSGNTTLIAGDTPNTGSLQGASGYNGDNILANTAKLNAPQDVAVDPSGNIYIADTLNYRIRKVTAATGIISTVAGNGTQGDTGDASAATSATINAYGISTDLAGDIFIATGTGGIVRKVDASGNINLFAGGGTGAIGGPASTGAVANAYFARTDNSGDLLIPTGTQLLAAGPDGLLQFGSDPVGTTTSALNVTLENTGDTTLTLGTTVATVTGTDASDFALTSSTCGYNLQPGKTCVLSVTFDPAATGARTASLSVPTNAAGSPQIVLLQGNGTAAAAPAASLSPTTISFPDTTAGTTSAAISTTLSNTGTAVLNISGITLTGANPTDFAETSTCGTTLAAGKTCTISATFTPAAVASYTASISVADDASGSPQTATLSGTGTAAPAPLAALSPTTLTFPATTAGTTATALTTTLSNTGNAVLNITGITLTGANPTDFALTTAGTTCGTTLAAGSTCTIAATFTPAAAGSFTASISVADNAAGSPQTATLTGTGTAPLATDFTLTATPPAQTVAPGAAANFTINTGGIGGAFDNAIQLTATGLPSGFTASFAPSSLTPGSNGASSVLSIQTTSLSALARPLHRSPRLPVTLAMLLLAPLLGLRKRFRKLRAVSICLLLFGSLAPVLMLTGCSGGYYNLQTKTYTVTVTGTSGSAQHSTTVTLTVQQ